MLQATLKATNATLLFGEGYFSRLRHTRSKGLQRDNATIDQYCSRLKDLVERLRRRSRGGSVRRIDVGQGRIEGSMPEVLADQEGIRALLDHQHRSRMFQDMSVLERLTEPGFLGDQFEELVNGDTVELRGLLGVEYEAVRVGLTNRQPGLQRSPLVEQSIALNLQ